MSSILLPIGTVVKLGESDKKVMIVGVCQQGGRNNLLYDYTGVPFPEGLIDSEHMIMFNNESIERIVCLGYQDEEQILFSNQIRDLLQKYREENQ